MEPRPIVEMHTVEKSCWWTVPVRTFVVFFCGIKPITPSVELAQSEIIEYFIALEERERRLIMLSLAGSGLILFQFSASANFVYPKTHRLQATDLVTNVDIDLFLFSDVQNMPSFFHLTPFFWNSRPNRLIKQ